MIIACSVKALQAVRQACANRIGKDGARPTIVDEKGTVVAVRRQLAARSMVDRFVWNLDLETSPVVDRDGKTSGYLTIGYLHNAVFRCTVVLNGLDDTDLCEIASRAGKGIRTLFDDFNIVPDATDAYLAKADDIDFAIRRECGVSFGSYDQLCWPKALLVPNGDRSATASVNHAKMHHQDILFGGGNPPSVSTRLIDRSGSFNLNREIVKYKGASGGYDVPLRRTRRAVQGLLHGNMAPAVTLRMRLLDHGYSWNGKDDAAFQTVPGFHRDVVVPLSASLSWLHQVIQKMMFWADYHLHAFRFLELDAREMLEHAFKSIYGFWECDVRDAAMLDKAVSNVFDAEGEEGFVRKTRMSLRWLYHDFMGAMEREGVIAEDFPSERLPEDRPLGEFILGTDGYKGFLEMTGGSGIKETIDAWGLYYNYDFGDDWELSIEPIGFSVEDLSCLPRIVGASGHTPPEDCGGLSGFREFLAFLESGECKDIDGCNLEQWARGNGWQPFEGLEKLEDLFDQPSTWEGCL